MGKKKTVVDEAKKEYPVEVRRGKPSREEDEVPRRFYL